jgi:alpha-beta hydrolase superfamily lysophospholipase
LKINTKIINTVYTIGFEYILKIITPEKNMRHEESSFKGTNNHNIYFQKWSPEGKPKAVILISHGYAEHSGRYMNVVNYLIPSGYQVYALDHMAHGKSDGSFDEITDFTIFVADLKNIRRILFYRLYPGRIYKVSGG